MKQSAAQVEQVHYHTFTPSFKQDEDYCRCGAIRISQEEYDRRCKEWESYFELVRTTDSYRDYMAMKVASKEEQKEILKRVNARIEKDEYMSKPSFPDPATWSKYITK